MPEEGYIKFNIKWARQAVDLPPGLHLLNQCRTRLFKKKLIGMYDNGIGFGNISMRADPGCFVISGSSTGNLEELEPSHFSLVEAYSIEKNYVKCRGLSKASSESLTHAFVYDTLPGVNCVIHIHNAGKWDEFKNILPTSRPGAEYGTPEMAKAVREIIRENNMAEDGIIIMGGHPEGILAFSSGIEKAEKYLYKMLGLS